MEFEPEGPDEPRLILGVPGVGAGLLARSSVEWLLHPEQTMESGSTLHADLRHWLARPLPGKYFGVTAVREAELGSFRALVQRAGWTYGAPDDVKALQLAVARAT